MSDHTGQDDAVACATTAAPKTGRASSIMASSAGDQDARNNSASTSTIPNATRRVCTVVRSAERTWLTGRVSIRHSSREAAFQFDEDRAA
jgi:hypothetical protein